jgi:uncharacterized protein YndB with AHSA1/START domain
MLIERLLFIPVNIEPPDGYIFLQLGLRGFGMLGRFCFRSCLVGTLSAASLLLVFNASQASAKEHKAYGSTIVINAPPEVVFEAIRKQRNSVEQHRTLEKFDGKIAVINEKLENVPIYGKVDCKWQETEDPYKRIDYKMLSSTKFKEGFGSWVLTPSADGKSTTLEFTSYTDSGLMVPFSGELTKMESMKTSKLRLQHIKEVSEDMQKHGGVPAADGASKAGKSGKPDKTDKSDKQNNADK